ncbi:hypothetical protein [Robbsia andropogonis]|uniref:hypothetical protein n=1 Tax=Robbsia andropogonis TaxID=28092 RepID=UPI001F377870|nr:hypothetical protein [Robbsia andropogonis]
MSWGLSKMFANLVFTAGRHCTKAFRSPIFIALLVSVFFLPVARAGEIYGQVGTQGGGVGYAVNFNSYIGAHADIDYGALSHSVSSGDTKYKGRLNLIGGGLYMDVFPFQSSSFRFTAGALIGNSYLKGDGESTGGTYRINGQDYAAAGQSVSAKISYPAVRPYLGIGFGHKTEGRRGVNVTADLGVAYGKPRVDYSVSAGLAAQAGAANVQAEEQRISDSVSKYRIYPVVQIGLAYRF